MRSKAYSSVLLESDVKARIDAAKTQYDAKSLSAVVTMALDALDEKNQKKVE
jgi:hypothetical protein